MTENVKQNYLNEKLDVFIAEELIKTICRESKSTEIFCDNLMIICETYGMFWPLIFQTWQKNIC